MTNVEIVCLNKNIAKRLAEATTKILVASGLDAVTYDPYGTLFARVIRLIRTYSALKISKQAIVLLEAAREWETRLNFYDNLENKDSKTIVAPNSIFVESFYWTTTVRLDIRKIFIKLMLKKLFNRPNYIIYVNIPKDKLQKLRASKQWKRRVEESMRGDGLGNRIKKYPIILEKISKRYGPKCCILEVENPNDIVGISKNISQFILEDVNNKHTEN